VADTPTPTPTPVPLPSLWEVVKREMTLFVRDNFRRILAWVVTIIAAVIYNWINHPAVPVQPPPPPVVKVVDLGN
jgi:hypothetical protein